MIEEVLEGLVEEDLAYKDGKEYGLTDLGLCEAEDLMRQGPIGRMMWYIKTTRMYMEQDKNKREKMGKEKQNKSI